ncbi:MAG: type II secretion system protein GspG [Planctomycetota bacterium]|nr:type II secretion system protein GspG [Planctomycetota bacterium]
MILILFLVWIYWPDFRRGDRDEQAETEAIMRFLAESIGKFQAEFEAPPTDLDELGRPGRSGYPFTAKIPLDVWGRRFRYSASRETGEWTLRSVGPDGHPETGDDLVISGVQPTR